MKATALFPSESHVDRFPRWEEKAQVAENFVRMLWRFVM